MKRPIAIDLFSGCGGMSMGLEAAGFDIAAAVEFDAVHSLVHHFNFPYSASLCRDISSLSTKELLDAIKKKGFKEEIDLIAGGPPCQGFSQIGKRQLDDSRNQLVFDYVRIIGEVRPKYFIFENVPGIAIGKHRQFLDELILDLEALGYRIAKPTQIVDASLLGAPQKRKRLILLGSRRDVPVAKYPEMTFGVQTIQNKSLFNELPRPLVTAEEAIGDLELFDAFKNGDSGIDFSKLDYSGSRLKYSPTSSGEYTLCHQRSLKPLIYGHIGSKHTELSIKRFAETLNGDTEKTSRFFKLHRQGQCNTIRAGTASDKGAYTAPRPIHYSAPRCITVREAARLHTFPDWFRFHNTIWHGFREIGNAVIPLLSKSLGSQILAAMEIDSNQLGTYQLDAVPEELLSYNMGQACQFWNIPDNSIAKRKKLVKEAA